MIEISGIKYITEKEASKLFGYSQSWFKERRSKKLPPIFVKFNRIGRIYYPVELIEKWFKDNMVVMI